MGKVIMERKTRDHHVSRALAHTSAKGSPTIMQARVEAIQVRSESARACELSA